MGKSISQAELKSIMFLILDKTCELFTSEFNEELPELGKTYLDPFDSNTSASFGIDVMFDENNQIRYDYEKQIDFERKIQNSETFQDIVDYVIEKANKYFEDEDIDFLIKDIYIDDGNIKKQGFGDGAPYFLRYLFEVDGGAVNKIKISNFNYTSNLGGSRSKTSSYDSNGIGWQSYSHSSYKENKKKESNMDLDSPKVANVSFYSFERNFDDKIRELLSHYKYGVYDIDRHSDLCNLLTDALKVWKDDSKDYQSKLEIIKDDLDISKDLIQKYYRKDTDYIIFINDMIKEIENYQSNSKEGLKESAIDYSSAFDKSKDIFHKGDFDKYKISDEELEDMMDDQTDLEECWQMLATMYEDIWNSKDENLSNEKLGGHNSYANKPVVDWILQTPIYWKEGFIKNENGAMLGCTRLEYNQQKGLGHPVVYISTMTDELDDTEFYNVLLHEMCHLASLYAYGSLDGQHSEKWKYFANLCNKRIEFLKGNELTPTCDADKF